MKMFTIDSKRTLLRGAAVFCAASFLSACAPAPAATAEAPLESTFAVSETVSASEAVSVSGALDASAETSGASTAESTALEIVSTEETVGLSELMDETTITIQSYDGEIGDYSFFACNETQVFGDYSIYQASYADEDYLMLSYNGVALLAKEDGSDAKLFYDGKRLDLPFPCDFNIEYKYIGLYEGDFSGTKERQLALIIPVETGSGINIESLKVINLDTMSLLPLYTDSEEYEESIYALFEGHFAETNMNREYYLFDYVQYDVVDDRIFVTYGACDEDDLYLSFLSGFLHFQDGTLLLDPEVSFQDEP